jgi:hypothetical protein
MIAVSKITRDRVEYPRAKNHPFNETMNIARESFESQGINIYSKSGIETVYGNPLLYEQYKDLMYGDIKNTDAYAVMETSLDHDKDMVLHGMDVQAEDGSVGNVTTYAYLNGPIIRAIWARSFVQTVMKTIPLKQPSYTLTFDIPFVIDEGVKKDLPYSLIDEEEPLIKLRRLIPKPEADAEKINADGSINLINKMVSGNILSESLFDGTPVNPFDGRHVDRSITVYPVRYKDETDTEVTLPLTLNPEEEHGAEAGNLIFKHEWRIGDELVLLVIFIDLNNGRYRAISTSDKVVSFTFEAYLSSEDNRTPIMLSTRQRDVSIRIGNGQHVMIDTPVELLQDYPTSHQGTDFAVSLTDVASQFFAGDLNKQCITFLNTSMIRPSTQIVPKEVLRGLNIPNAKFNILVAHGENPSAYVNEQLKKCISYYINKIRSFSRLEDGYWSLIGHALNMMHIPDFKKVTYDQRDDNGDEQPVVQGFKVGYVFGFGTNIINNGKVRCLYTPEMRLADGIVGFFTSTDDRRPTYIFHVYSYTVSRGYQNPNNPYIPSIMITKRHMFNEFVPSQFRLQLLGNDDNQFISPYTPATPATAYVPGVSNSIPSTP